ncbi:MAG: aspartate aminotransferase family protein [Candidatus Eremiobacterota bacterium]
MPTTLTRSEELFAAAQHLIPGGVGGIRRPYNFVPGEYPIFLEKGQGGYIFDVDGNRYIDLLCSYGPIILGHREKEVDEAVIEQIRDYGFCFNLAQAWQNRLAERLIQIIPSAERVILVKTGSDATTAAIRVARGHTGRLKVLRCGYHGWHDWCVEVKAGIPAKLYEDVHEFHYNRLDELKDLLEKHSGEVAAVIVTPVGHPLAHPVQAPAPGFLEGVRQLASEHGAVLVFDEIRSGFRVALGGAQERYGVIPDITVIGKAMANGYPISAVVGKQEFLAVAESKVFISSTFFPNSLEMVAALKTMEVLQRENALDRLWKLGQRLLDGLEKSRARHGAPATVSGIPPMPFITFNADPEGRYKQLRVRFYTEMIRRGIFMAPYHHGYICCRHSDEDIDAVLAAADEAFASL